MVTGINMDYPIPLLLMLLFFGTQSEASINCDFENDVCGWEQLTSDEFDWTRFSGTTPSTPTGPDYDHTKGDANGFYMYTEAGYFWPPYVAGDNAIMRSPYPIQLHSADSDLCFGFWFHMYGINIGSLNVYFTTSETSVPMSDVIWSRSNDIGNVWIQAEIRVTSFISSSKTGYFAFQGVMTDGYFGDIAVDDVTLGACTLTTDSTTTVVSTTDSDPIVDGSSSGTSFAFAFPTNSDHGPGTETYLIFTTTSCGTVSVVVTGDQFSSSFSMDTSAPHTLILEPIPLSVGSGIQESTVVIEASDDVSVQGRSVDGISLEEFTPISNTGLGTEYVIASYPPLASAGYQSQFTLTTGETSSTSITIRFAQSYEYEGETYTRFKPLEMDLTSHQTVQFQSLTDLTASTISSSQPVSVVSGDSCAQIPVGVQFCNYMVEQLPPVERWGRTVVFSGYHGRTSGTIIRFIVSSSGAKVNIMSGLTTTQSFSSATATYQDLDIGHNTDPITITANNPILVLMYHKSVYTDYIGDPAMAIVPAVEQWTSGVVTFDVIDQQSNQAADHISITIETVNEAGIALNTVLVTTISGVQSLRHGIYTIFRMNIIPGYHTVQHQDASVRYSVLVYGTNIYNSYAYPARMDLPLTSQAESVLTDKVVH